MASSINWAGDTSGTFAATLVGQADRLHLVVEPLPHAGFDWLVWATADTYGTHRATLDYGTAPSASAAMQAAENASRRRCAAQARSGPPR